VVAEEVIVEVVEVTNEVEEDAVNEVIEVDVEEETTEHRDQSRQKKILGT